MAPQNVVDEVQDRPSGLHKNIKYEIFVLETRIICFILLFINIFFQKNVIIHSI